jgi:hypothetical protein
MKFQHSTAASRVSAGAGRQFSDRAGPSEPARGTVPPEGAVNPNRSDPIGPPPAETATIADRFLGLFWGAGAVRLPSSRCPVVLMYHAVAPGLGGSFGWWFVNDAAAFCVCIRSLSLRSTRHYSNPDATLRAGRSTVCRQIARSEFLTRLDNLGAIGCRRPSHLGS